MDMSVSVRFGFENTFAKLPERFYARVNPTSVASPRLVRVNRELADLLQLDFDALASAEGVEVLAGNRVAEGSAPLAMAYAGHQFGNFVAQLGDGRANLLGEVVGRDGIRYDVQLKGAGRTPFSRGGDGRAAIGPVLREYLVSEAMAAMGVPTTRALAAVLTGETVMREGELPGAVLTRVARSHLRVGSFEYFAARHDVEGIRLLAEYAMARHYPEAVAAERPFRAFLDGVVGRQASLVARWMGLGFVHGVMNTDNTSISGETIDYGPCAFLEGYDPATVFSSIDRQGRYAYGNQPRMMLWNLTRLAESLLPVLEQESGSEEAAVGSAQESLEGFAGQYAAARLAEFRRKLGLVESRDEDEALVEDLLEWMAAGKSDWTRTFRGLSEVLETAGGDFGGNGVVGDAPAFAAWVMRWRSRLAAEGADLAVRAKAMRGVNPAYIPRNHRVEAALRAAAERLEFGPFEELLGVVTSPFEEREGLERYGLAAKPEEAVRWTFCGT
jgi:uncharacterized protein YdiU (UPF0061 family)